MFLLRRFFCSAVTSQIVVLLSACEIPIVDFDHVEIPDYEPTLALPIGASHYTMIELLDGLQSDGFSIDESEGRFMTLVFSDTVVNTNRDAYLSLASFAKSNRMYPSVSEGPFGDTRKLEFEQTYTYSFDGLHGERIDSILFKHGTLGVALNSNIQSKIYIELSIPALTTGFSGTTIYDTLSAQAGLPSHSEKSVPVAGKKFTLRSDAGSNHFDVVLKATVELNADETLRFTDYIGFSFSFADYAHSQAYGYFGTKEVPLQDSFIDMSFFEKFGDSGIDFKEPTISILVTNSYGFPLGLSLAGLSATNNDSTILPLTGMVSEKLHYVNYSEESDPADLRTTEIVIDNQNSNISDLFGVTPTRFNLPLVTVSNPPDYAVVPLNFITDTSYLQTITLVELPLEVKLDTFVTNLVYSLEGVDLDEVEEASLRIHTINEIPLEATLALSFSDADSVPFYFLKERLALVAPPLDENGRTIDATSLLAEIFLYPEGTAALKRAENLTVSIIIDSATPSDDEYIKLFADDEITVSVSISGKLQISF